ncbi:unnamed protein product [Closterium sp. Naga37s-1]|nr:unnamed protein product [Closterium sp. Naga37s-1]
MTWRALLREAWDRAALMTQFACCYHVFTNYVMDVTMVRDDVSMGRDDVTLCMGPSMLPTLNAAGDVVLLEHITPALHALKPGDIVVAKSPSNPRMMVCKRVVAMEGHEVHAMPPPPRGFMGGRGKHAETHAVVPRGHVWLQGDNLFNSTDSRHYGLVPLALVKGRVFYRVWPPRDCGPVR